MDIKTKVEWTTITHICKRVIKPHYSNLLGNNMGTIWDISPILNQTFLTCFPHINEYLNQKILITITDQRDENINYLTQPMWNFCWCGKQDNELSCENKIIYFYEPYIQYDSIGKDVKHFVDIKEFLSSIRDSFGEIAESIHDINRKLSILQDIRESIPQIDLSNLENSLGELDDTMDKFRKQSGSKKRKS